MKGHPSSQGSGFCFFFVLDWLCGFDKLSSFILFQELVFQQGENLQQGNFPLGAVTQLSGDGNSSWVRPKQWS